MLGLSVPTCSPCARGWSESADHPSQLFLSNVNGSSSFVRKWRKSWLNQGTSGRRETLSSGTTFFHINGGLICWLFYPWRIYIYMFWHSANPFDLWLFLRAWPHTPQAFSETSRHGGHVLLESDTTRSDHSTGNSVSYSFQTVLGFFYVPQNFEQWRAAKRGLRFTVLIPKDLRV